MHEDPSIRFPDFFEHSAVMLGAQGQPFEVDGVTLQALLIATRDFLPPGSKDQPCRDRLEAHRYRVIRQEDIVFVQIEDDDEFCGLKYLSLDTGARYAIHIDGRILRRSAGAEPEERLAPLSPDAGTAAFGPDNPPRDVLQFEPAAKPGDGGTGPLSPAPSHDGGTPVGG